MYIQEVSCDYFAGLSHKNLVFTPGVNVIFGPNEAGKSSILQLIASLLFQHANINKKTDAAFLSQCFPAQNRDGRMAGNSIDGTLVLETEQGKMTLQKTWATADTAGGASFRLLTPTEPYVSDAAEQVLKELLPYPEPIYSELLLYSQRNAENSVRTILEASGSAGNKQALAQELTKALSESGGAAIADIERAIEKEYARVCGSHWDFLQQRPIAGKNGRYKTELGEILQAYYASEDAENLLRDLETREKEADAARAAYKKAEEAWRMAAAEAEAFRPLEKQLSEMDANRRSLEEQQKRLQEYKQVLRDWPILEKQVQEAERLLRAKENRTLADRYAEAKVLHDALQAWEQEKQTPCPTQEDVKRARELDRKRGQMESMTQGLRIKGSVVLQNGHTMEISALRNHETLQNLSAGETEVDLREAVSIRVPDVLQMTLTPENMDAADWQQQYTSLLREWDVLLSKFQAKDLEDVERLFAEREKQAQAAENKKEKLSALLGADSFETLAAQAQSLGENLLSEEEVARQIQALCGAQTPEAFSAVARNRLQGYQEKYDSPAALDGQVETLVHAIEALEKRNADIAGIPEEYQNIADPAAYLNRLLAQAEDLRQQKEDLHVRSAGAEKALETFRNDHPEDLREQAEECERILHETKERAAHWKHIQDVFAEEKAKMSDTPLLKGMTDCFCENLDALTKQALSSDFPDPHLAQPALYNALQKKVQYETLSSGSRDTVFLAYQLAVLRSLFPEGGGILALDDICANMDIDRRDRACALLEKYGESQQVLFFTCREEYFALLPGNHIRL